MASLVNVTRQHIKRIHREVMGEKFSAKDFRTWAGNWFVRAPWRDEVAKPGSEAR